jgi:hypothetical protein
VDLNQLYPDHQIPLMRCERAPAKALRHLQDVAPSHVAGRIGNLQRGLRDAAPSWESLASPAADTLSSPGRHGGGYRSCAR